MFGLYISAGVSLWRLIEHDFGNEGGANQKPALQVLYGLAVAQGVLFGYKTIHSLGARNRLAKLAAAELGMVDEELVAEYLEETVAGCEKDPSFASGRNLITYGAGLMMEAKSNEDFIAGIRVLGGAIKRQRGRKVLGKHLLTSRSDFWSHMLQRLLEIVCPESPYSFVVRGHAARIVALVARRIRLVQFPGVMERICSVIVHEGPSGGEELSLSSQSRAAKIRRDYAEKLKDYERVELLEEYELEYLIRYNHELPTEISERQRRNNRARDFDRLLKEAMNIIHQLAVDGDNRRIMSNTILQKFAMAPLKLHTDSHSLRGLFHIKYWVPWLVAAIKETNNNQVQILEEGQPIAVASGGGGRRRSEKMQEKPLLQSSMVLDSALGNAIISIEDTIASIFDCLDCRGYYKRQAVQILLHLSLDMSFIMASESRKRRLTWILLIMICYPKFRENWYSEYWMISAFADEDDFARNRSLASEKLSSLLGDNKNDGPSDQSARELQYIRLALGDLASAFADDADEDISIRTHATIIMEDLLFQVLYDPFSDFGKEVDEILAGIIPKVVKEILVRCASTGEERQAAQDWPDVEKGVLESSRDMEQLRKVLVRLCRDGYMMRAGLSRKFKDIAVKICEEQGKSFEDFKSLLV
ncbi:hypothetical protein HU200_008832 [Digitaria exilis]|uniref:Uncharacterized protein n=1 Tax=Digitaria exilis TaxID=1010633 RepID=A0A835FKU3_9POAL|nr:hypothetical protein HU200_008832 [Digitaria exilis]